ncbi:hypothetical protein [Gordonia effusa]|uniref:hypothetical protein n=1 Tax=Gordonia effusa TaxID=263908 RepID=UPI00110F9041|nr:hypothetical protein [Gordonia effusa]
MKIDCETCPARRVACDGCMMQVLFEPLSSDDVTPDEQMAIVSSETIDDRELLAAIDVFSAASMVSRQDATSARNAIAARQDGAGRGHLRILRAS